jgi:outer membrane protein TolC
MRIHIWIIIGLAGFVMKVHAQNRMTLEQCLERARRNNLQLQNTRIALQAGKYARQALIASQRPGVKASGNLSYAPHSDRFGYDPAITDGGQVGAQIIIQQPLYFGKTRRLQLARDTLEQSLLATQLGISERDLTLAVTRQFIESLADAEEIRLRRVAIERLADYLAWVRLQNAAGAAEYGDILKTRTQLSATQEMLQKAEETAALSKMELAALMGMTLEAPFELEGNLDSMLSAEGDTAYTLDTAKFSELTMARREIEKSRVDLTLLKKEQLPSVSLTLDGGYLCSFDRLTSSESKTALGLAAGASIDWPLVDWGARHSRQLQQLSAIDTMQNAAAILSRSIATEYQGALLQLHNARALLAMIRERIADAQDDYLLSKSKNVAGALGASELLLAQQAFADAQIDELRTKAAIVTMAAKLAPYSSPTR